MHKVKLLFFEVVALIGKSKKINAQVQIYIIIRLLICMERYIFWGRIVLAEPPRKLVGSGKTIPPHIIYLDTIPITDNYKSAINIE